MLSEIVIDALVEAGVTAEQLAARMKAAAREANDKALTRRANDADRQRQSRARRNQKDVTVTSCDSRDVTNTPPNDIYSNPPEEPCETIVSQSPFADEFRSAWNTGPAANGARQVKGLGASRLKKLKSCVDASGQAGVLAAVEAVADSDFHCGGGQRRWRADIDWLLDPENCLKMIERGSDDGEPVANDWSEEKKAEYLAGLARNGQRTSTSHMSSISLPSVGAGSVAIEMSG